MVAHSRPSTYTNYYFATHPDNIHAFDGGLVPGLKRISFSLAISAPLMTPSETAFYEQETNFRPLFSASSKSVLLRALLTNTH